MSGFSTDVILLMILIALVTAAVLLIRHKPGPTATRRMLRTADRVLKLAGSRTPADRARAELLEPPEHDRA